MQAADFVNIIKSHLPYVPNRQQEQVLDVLARFCSPKLPDDCVFVLNGYAGTGKTSLTGALVKALREVGINSVLLAPTGRAAKVFAAYSGHSAFTIHRYIYRHVMPGDTSSTVHAVKENRSKNTVFIVDEASMIGAASADGSDLLRDLIHYVYTGDNCRLILIGDTAQLPPVGCDESPAMQPHVLRSYGLRVSRATLTATARQQAGSGILLNATILRRCLASDDLPQTAPVVTKDLPDVIEISPADLPEAVEQAYRNDGIEETILITRSNQRATAFNQAIRSQVLYLESELEKGEPLLVVKNNYHWTRDIKSLDFLANGDMVAVNKIYGTEFKYGFRFADVRLSLLDRPELEFDAKIMLETLTNEVASLPRERLEKLYYAIMSDPDLFSPETPYQARLKVLQENPHWCALQVKYAYAVTCHKAQGGQWQNVFVDMGFVPADATAVDYYRWLYTAVSRAKSTLYLVNSTPEY